MNRAIAHGVHHPSITHEERKRCYSTVAVNHSGTHKGAKTYVLQQDGRDNDVRGGGEAVHSRDAHMARGSLKLSHLP